MKILLLILLFAFSVFGQNIEAVTKDGKKVILKPDKSWEYASEVKTTSVSDCSAYTKTTTDRITGKSYFHSNSIIVSNDDGKTGFLLLAQKHNDIIILTIKGVDKGLGCLDDNQEINILFTDGSRLTVASNSKFNCDNKLDFYFGGLYGKSSELNQLTTKKISALRMNSRKSSMERDFNDEQATAFMESLKCLLKNS